MRPPDADDLHSGSRFVWPIPDPVTEAWRGGGLRRETRKN